MSVIPYLRHESARFEKRLRQRCQQAAAIVTPSRATYDEALEAGFSSSTYIIYSTD
jgi:hypothetical protein